MISGSNKLDGILVNMEIGKKYYDLSSSDYYENQTWGALNKCWLGFVIAKEKEEWDKLDMYARRIQKFERQLGREVTDFSNWGVIIKINIKRDFIFLKILLLNRNFLNFLI